MKRILLSFVVIFALGFAAKAGPSGESKRFDDAFQKALAALSPEERSLLESPIFDNTDWMEKARKEAARQEEDYERMLPHATPETKKDMTEQLSKSMEILAYLTSSQIVRREQLARSLGYAKWLPAGTPLLEVFSLSGDEIKVRGLVTTARETRYRTFAFLTPDPASRVNVDIAIKPSLAETRTALLLPNDLLSKEASDFRICEQPYGDACVAETGGIGWSHFKFARSNVLVELRGPSVEVGRLAAWIDEALKKQVAASGKVVEEVQQPVIVLKGQLPAPPQRAAPMKTPPLPRDEDVLVIEEPRPFDKLGAVVPDGTKTVTVRIRLLDPRVTEVFVSNGRERKILKPVDGQVSATFSLDGTSAVITVQAKTEPQGQFHGIIGTGSIEVMTESDHRALDEMWRERAATPAPKK